MKYRLIVLAVLLGAFLWQHRTWSPVYRHWQARQQLDRDFEQAALQGDVDKVQRLLHQGEDVHANYGAMPLAFEITNLTVLQVFLDRGFSVNTSVKTGGPYPDTLLAEAAGGADELRVRFLLEHGADVRTQGAGALAAARAGMDQALEQPGAAQPPDEASARYDERAAEAAARAPYEAVISLLRQAGAHE